MTAQPIIQTPVTPRVAVTRGMRRKQARDERRRKRVPANALIVGVDLAREKQALCFMHQKKMLAQICHHTTAADFQSLFDATNDFARKHQLADQVWAMEPTGHYWMLLAEQCEKHGLPYVLIHPLSVAREREGAHYNREKTDPKDAELVATLASNGKIIDTVLPRTKQQAALQDLAYAYFYARSLSASAKTALHNFWHRLLPEFFYSFKNVDGLTAIALAQGLLPFSELVELKQEQWCKRIKEYVKEQRMMRKRAGEIYQAIIQAASNKHRRADEGMPWRIRQAAERRLLFETQKKELRAAILKYYQATEASIYMDSIVGADSFCNALTLGLVGDFNDYDDPRAIVKLAGSEINQFGSGDSIRKCRISHRGRSRLRTVAYQQARFLAKRNPELTERFLALINTKKLTHTQSYVAIANSYLRTAHVLVTKKQFYRSKK